MGYRRRTLEATGDADATAAIPEVID